MATSSKVALAFFLAAFPFGVIKGYYGFQVPVPISYGVLGLFAGTMVVLRYREIRERTKEPPKPD